MPLNLAGVRKDVTAKMSMETLKDKSVDTMISDPAVQ